MNICIIHYAEPIYLDNDSADNRYLMISKSLITHKNSVLRIAPTFSHRQKKQRNFPINGHSSEFGSYQLIKTCSYFNNRSFKRLVFLYQFSVGVIKLLSGKKFDLVIVGIPLAGILFKLKNIFKNNTKFIADFRDDWPAIQLETSKGLDKIFFLIFKNFFFNNLKKDLYASDGIVAISQSYLDRTFKICKKNIPRITLPLGSPTLFFEKLDKNKHRDKKKGFIFLGTIHEIFNFQLLKNIWDFLLRNHHDFCEKNQLTIIGDGPELDNVKILFSRSKFVNFKGRVSQPQAYKYLKNSRFAFLLYKKIKFLTIPNKLFEYSSAGLPIITNVDSDSKKILEKYNSGIFIDKNLDFETNMLNIQKKIIYSKNDNFFKNAYQLAIDFDRSLIAENYIKFINLICNIHS